MDASAASSASGVPSAGGQPTPNKSHGAVIMVSIAAALGGFLFGYDTAVINGTVDAIQAQFGMSARRCSASSSRPRCSAARSAPGSPGRSPTASAASASCCVAAALFAVSAIGSGARLRHRGT